ncbi:ATP-binding protein [Leptolyngbya sp. CCY15150]|uniref:sensor histidine kinase n=1 Tax=Leptolyngbya sp. CCY15150 TaxID=2767772 RepID=UPI00194ECA4E|nr:ATP-binding protein [Leptolyngbya sp. CCY15150]
MKWLREGTWITSGFILTLIVTGVMSFTSYQNSVQLVNSANQVRQTNEMLDALNDISALLADAELRHWRYVIFNDVQELEQYYSVIQRLDPTLYQLDIYVSDTLLQAQRLQSLKGLIDERLIIFQRAIAQYGGRPDKIVATDSLIIQSQRNLREIQSLIADLEHEEEQIIAAQLEDVRTNSRTRMLIEPIGALLTFSIVVGVFILLYRQLSKRQLAEAIQQSLAQEKELSELKLHLFSMVSHEFRTPLSLILGSSQLLEESLKDMVEPARLKNLYRIQTSAKTMTQLLNDILMLARADAGKLEYNPKWLEIQTFCLNLIEDFQIFSHARRSLSFQQKGDRTHAYLDEKLTYSILSNILSNAVKYSSDDSTIYFTLIDEQDAIVFQIRDEGIGIPSADLEKMYEPFNRGSNTREIRGTGLGLAVVRKCLALHQGDIKVQSEVGVGTSFTIKIPQDVGWTYHLPNARSSDYSPDTIKSS